MKKNRASFFGESANYSQTNVNIPNQNMMYPANNPYAGGGFSAESSFYAGNMNNMMPNNQMNMQDPNAVLNGQMPMPMLPQNNQMNMNTNVDNTESRLAKIERQLNRMEHRLTKLEQNTTLSSDDLNSSINDMYMV